MTKTCTRCQESLPLDEFPRRYDRAPGARHSACRICRARDDTASRAKRLAQMSPIRRAAEAVKLRAQEAVRYRVRCGLLVPPPACECCATIGKVVSHHHDYAHALDVVWLCARCHGAEHAALSGTPADPHRTAIAVARQAA